MKSYKEFVGEIFVALLQGKKVNPVTGQFISMLVSNASEADCKEAYELMKKKITEFEDSRSFAEKPSSLKMDLKL